MTTSIVRTLVFVVIAMGAMYLLIYLKPRIWRFGLLTEKEIREKAKLDVLPSVDDYLLSTLSSNRWSVVVPLESEAVSKLPTQMYEGESELIVLCPRLKPAEEKSPLLVIDLAATVGGDKKAGALKESRTDLENYAVLKLVRQKVEAQKYDKFAKYLAVELLASGFNVAGEAKQRHELGMPNPIFTWNVTAKASGDHKIALVITAEDEHLRELAQLGTIFHQVRVITILHLTQRQVRVCLGIVGFVTTSLAIFQALQQLRILP